MQKHLTTALSCSHTTKWAWRDEAWDISIFCMSRRFCLCDLSCQPHPFSFHANNPVLIVKHVCTVCLTVHPLLSLINEGRMGSGHVACRTRICTPCIEHIEHKHVVETHLCWGVWADGRSEPLSPASDDLRINHRENNSAHLTIEPPHLSEHKSVKNHLHYCWKV